MQVAGSYSFILSYKSDTLKLFGFSTVSQIIMWSETLFTDLSHWFFMIHSIFFQAIWLFCLFSFLLTLISPQALVFQSWKPYSEVLCWRSIWHSRHLLRRWWDSLLAWAAVCRLAKRWDTFDFAVSCNIHRGLNFTFYIIQNALWFGEYECQLRSPKLASAPSDANL